MHLQIGLAVPGLATAGIKHKLTHVTHALRE